MQNLTRKLYNKLEFSEKKNICNLRKNFDLRHNLKFFLQWHIIHITCKLNDQKKKKRKSSITNYITV